MQRVVLGTITEICEFPALARFLAVKSSSIRAFTREKMFEFIDECYHRSLAWKADQSAEPRLEITAYSSILKNGEEIDEFDDEPVKGKVTVSAIAIFRDVAEIYFEIKKMEIIVDKTYEDEKTEVDIAKCIVCVENKKNILFSCGHMSTCWECSSKIKKCPVCRANIETKTRVFW